jgi:hypothetical protein
MGRDSFPLIASLIPFDFEYPVAAEPRSHWRKAPGSPDWVQKYGSKFTGLAKTADAPTVVPKMDEALAL